VEVRKGQAGLTGSMMVMRYWFGRTPVRWDFRYRRVFQFSNGIPQSLMAKYLWIRYDRFRPWTTGFENLFSSTDLCFRFFCMMERASCFLFFLSHYLARLLGSEQTGRLDFLFSSSQRFRRTFTFDDTLVFNDCIMEWVNIPRMGLGGLSNQSPRLGTIKRFLFIFLSLWPTELCHQWLSKWVGMALRSINTKIFHT